MRFSLIFCLAVALSAVSSFPSATSAQSAVADSLHRPAAWAVPLEKPGLPNLFRVTDTLYRGAQPPTEGFAELTAMGVKSVLNLRSFHADDLGNTGLRYFSIPMNSWHPEEEDAVRFLQIVTDTNNLPVFVHCRHGSDRTGAMCAIYRIAVQGWTKDEAIREMTEGGYGFHEFWENLIDFIQALDVDAIRSKAGVKAP
jgi:tyrosine-protein phosphatase SIW14